MTDPNAHLQTSEDGLLLIIHFEGLGPHFDGKIALPYICPAGKKTAGHGHVVLPGENFDKGLTPAEAHALLIKDLRERFEPIVRRWVRVPLTQAQFDALVAFVFNVGEGQLTPKVIPGFCTSTLLKKVNESKFAEAAAWFRPWNKAWSKKLRKLIALDGLTRRRLCESKRFEGWTAHDLAERGWFIHG